MCNLSPPSFPPKGSQLKNDFQVVNMSLPSASYSEGMDSEDEVEQGELPKVPEPKGEPSKVPDLLLCIVPIWRVAPKW